MSDELAELDLVGLLERLGTVPEPPAVPLWPQTAGWIWVGVVGIAACVWATRRWIRQRRANAYRRAALAAVAAAGDDAAALAAILRRTALAAYPRTRVAALHGEAWLDFLDGTYGGEGFRKGPGRALVTAPYRSTSTIDGTREAGLAALVREWVRRHRPPAPAPTPAPAEPGEP